ncbi:hypothetical protein [uncultured Desulfovibrio sp.]|uniref:hypothetical protein n=1 Tax=uncultured Desulfovibrio sp. TaxID=167968 RepID=UPI0025E8D80B|nr:hypothetical protein [uncultured Desulfovibrio sp.]
MYLLKVLLVLVVALVVVPTFVGGISVYVGWAASFWPVALTTLGIVSVIIIALGWFFGKFCVVA